MKKLKQRALELGAGEVLSREQLKRVMGGFTETTAEDDAGFCAISTSCRLYVRELAQTYDGTCYYQIGGKCFCGVTVNGSTYTTDPGTTSVCYKEIG